MFVGCTETAIENGPAGTVAGVEGVVDLPGEVAEPEFVEPLGVVLAEYLKIGALGIRDKGVVGHGFRRKVVGRVAAHFVEVDIDIGKPFEE